MNYTRENAQLGSLRARNALNRNDPFAEKIVVKKGDWACHYCRTQNKKQFTACQNCKAPKYRLGSNSRISMFQRFARSSKVVANPNEMVKGLEAGNMNFMQQFRDRLLLHLALFSFQI